MPRRPLPDTRRREEQRFSRIVNRVSVAVLLLAALAILVLYLVA